MDTIVTTAAQVILCVFLVGCIALVAYIASGGEDL